MDRSVAAGAGASAESKKLYNQVVRIDGESGAYEYWFVLTYLPDLQWCHVAPLEKRGTFGAKHGASAGRPKWMLVAEEHGGEIDVGAGRCHIVQAKEMRSTKENADEEEWDEAMLVRFVLRKEKQDTLGAVADLAEALGVPERAFSYAGLKDFHAVTVQEVVVQGVPPSRLRALQLARLQLGRIRLVERKLRLGECGGNRFRIRLRRLTRGRVAVG